MLPHLQTSAAYWNHASIHTYCLPPDHIYSNATQHTAIALVLPSFMRLANWVNGPICAVGYSNPIKKAFILAVAYGVSALPHNAQWVSDNGASSCSPRTTVIVHETVECASTTTIGRVQTWGVIWVGLMVQVGLSSCPGCHSCRAGRTGG